MLTFVRKSGKSKRVVKFNPEFWDKVIEYILLDEQHVGFDICLQEFLSSGVNGFPQLRSHWYQHWEQVCHKTKNKDLLTHSLIYNTAKCSCNIQSAHQLWSILISCYLNTNLERVITSLISENIELLQQTGHKEDLFEIFDEDIFINKVLNELKPDGLLISFLNATKEVPGLDHEKIEGMHTIISLLMHPSGFT